MLARFISPALAVIIIFPVIVVVIAWALPDPELWQHFATTLLSELLLNTLILLAGVGIGVAVLGTTLAWLVVMVEFPGRKFLEWLLFLPFAVPAYVLAFVYLGIFDYGGGLQTLLREYLGFSGFDIRNGYLAIILVFTLVFYPYVYLMARASFKRHQASLFASARLLGASPRRVFYSVSVPLAYPAISAGVLVTMMETLADFGAVSLFNYSTFTTAIYSAWEDFRSIEVAAQLASILVLIAAVLIYFDYLGRHHIKYYNTEVMRNKPYQLSGIKGYLLTSFITSIVLISFILPLFQLVLWILTSPHTTITISNYSNILINTLILATSASFIIVLLANILTLSQKQNGINLNNITTKLASLGYAVPGSVLAVGLLYGVSLLSNITDYLYNITLNEYLFGSVILLLLAYTTRFMAIAYQSISAAFLQLKPNLSQSAKLLGSTPLGIALRVQLPLMKPGIIAASLLVMIDVIKELPATYLLRPFGWDTLAVKVYEYSHEALYAQAAIPALMMVIIATLLIVVFRRFDRRIL